METIYKVGDTVKVNAKNVLDSQKGQIGRVMLTFSEPSAYTGQTVNLLDVLVAGRHARVAAWEVEPA